jgi:hypothetical protein
MKETNIFITMGHDEGVGGLCFGSALPMFTRPSMKVTSFKVEVIFIVAN